MRRAAFGIVGLLAACAPSACPPAELSPLHEAPRYALVSSDFGASAIAVLGDEGELLDGAWVDSGTARPGIVAALSGDVSLPSAPSHGCTLVLLDRFGTDVVTVLDTCGGAPVRAQIDVGARFAANPQDALALDDRTLWVSRLTVNLAAEPDAMDRGNDVAIVDLASGRVIDRVDLSALDGPGEVYARPTRMALVARGDARRVVVGTARLSLDFGEAGSGAVAVVDLQTRVARPLPLDGLTNCGEVDPVPSDAAAVVVTCAGATFGTEADRRASAGVVRLTLDEDGSLVEEARFAAADHPGVGAPSSGTVPLGGGAVVTIAAGDVGVTPDRALRLDLYAGTAEELFAAAEAFVLGEGAYDATAERLFVPDAAAAVVRRFEAGVEIEPVDATGCRGLPPREVARIR